MNRSNDVAAWKIWQCEVCGWIYDEEKGAPDEGLAPGTRWSEVPEDWQCPDCFAFKRDFVMVEIASPVDENPDETPFRRNTSDPKFASFPIVVVGSGLAGYNLVRELRALGNEHRIIVVTEDDGSYYPKPVISNAISANRSPDDIRIATADDMARAYDIVVKANSPVESVDVRRRSVRLNTGETIGYSKLVLATGSECIDPGFSGNGSRAVYRVNDLRDFARFRKGLRAARDIIVIGAGLIGCEFANDLCLAGYKVTIIELASRPLQSLLPEEASAAVTRALSGIGIQFLFDRSIAAIERSGPVTSVRLEDGQRVAADIVLSAVGVKPNTVVARLAGLAIGRGIRVNRFMETSEIDVFALGDCAEVQQTVYPFVLPLTAAARSLAMTLHGRNTEVRFGVMPIHIKTPTVPVVCYRAPTRAACHWHVVLSDGADCTAELRTAMGTLVGVALTGACVEETQQYVAKLPPLMDEGFITAHGRSVPEYFYREPRNWTERLGRFWWGA